MEATAIKTPYQHGLDDGAEAFRTSGTTVDPVDGWDGDLLNAIGLRRVCDLFGLEYDVERRGTTERLQYALEDYMRGCQDGVRAQESEAA